MHAATPRAASVSLDAAAPLLLQARTTYGAAQAGRDDGVAAGVTGFAHAAYQEAGAERQGIRKRGGRRRGDRHHANRRVSAVMGRSKHSGQVRIGPAQAFLCGTAGSKRVGAASADPPRADGPAVLKTTLDPPPGPTPACRPGCVQHPPLLSSRPAPRALANSGAPTPLPPPRALTMRNAANSSTWACCLQRGAAWSTTSRWDRSARRRRRDERRPAPAGREYERRARGRCRNATGPATGFRPSLPVASNLLL
eukprot:365569-Chlamydomonas_euryale.AAC.31